MANESHEPDTHESPESGQAVGAARRPWTTPKVTPARIEATTSKLFSVVESSPSDFGPFS